MKKRTQKKNTLRKNKSLRKRNKPLKNSKKKSRKKTNRKVYRKSNKKTNRKENKRNKNEWKENKDLVQSGGGTKELNNILDVLLSREIISFIPTSQIFDYNKIDRYVRMVDVETLKDIVLENIEFKKSPTIQKIFNYSSDELKAPEKIMLNSEDINCKNLIEERNQFVKKLFLYLFECNEDTYIKKEINWFRIICGLDELDETYEYYCMKELIDMGLFLDKKEILEKTKILEDNPDFRLIMKKRLYNCSEKPRTFFENAFGGISFPSYLECDKKTPGNILYLYDEYKRFLAKDHEELTKLDKVKILIFCETRQHLLSKHIALELVRINDKNYTHIRVLLKKIYNLDYELIKENDKKLVEIQNAEEAEIEQQLNLKNNLENIDTEYSNEPQELTEEEIKIQELEEQRNKSLNEGNNFQNKVEEIENKINNQNEIKGGASNQGLEPNGVTPNLELPFLKKTPQESTDPALQDKNQENIKLPGNKPENQLDPLPQNQPLDPLPQNQPLDPLPQNKPLDPLPQNQPLDPLPQNQPLDPLPQNQPLDPLPQNQPLDPLPQNLPEIQPPEIQPPEIQPPEIKPPDEQYDKEDNDISKTDDKSDSLDTEDLEENDLSSMDLNTEDLNEILEDKDLASSSSSTSSTSSQKDKDKAIKKAVDTARLVEECEGFIQEINATNQIRMEHLPLIESCQEIDREPFKRL